MRILLIQTGLTFYRITDYEGYIEHFSNQPDSKDTRMQLSTIQEEIYDRLPGRNDWILNILPDEIKHMVWDYVENMNRIEETEYPLTSPNGDWVFHITTAEEVDEMEETLKDKIYRKIRREMEEEKYKPQTWYEKLWHWIQHGKPAKWER